MNWLYKLERKYSKYAINNLMQYIIMSTVTIYILQYIMKINLYPYLAFIPKLVMEGQIWRVITFIFLPPYASVFSMILMSYFFYMIGNTLEYQWGSFKFNIYYLFGIIGAIIAAFITGYGTNTYLNLSLFLAFAYMFPDVEVNLFYLIPIKIKWLAYLDWFYFGYSLIFGSFGVKVATVMSLINFFIFFGKDFINFIKNRKRYGSVQRNFRKEMRKANSKKKY